MKPEPLEDGWVVPGLRLNDFRQRARWANLDGTTLDASVREYNDLNPYMARIKHNGHSGNATAHRVIDPAEELAWHDMFARLLGSFLDNNRAALNYLTYEFAHYLRARYPVECAGINPNAVEFPIFTSKSLFWKQSRIQTFPDEYRHLFDAVQPYDGRYEGLLWLHELAREYRHRVLHTVAIIPLAGHSITTNSGTITSITEVDHGRPIRHDDELLTFTIENFTGGNDDVNGNIKVAVGIDHPICGRRDCMDVLNAISKDVIAAHDLLAPYLVPWH